MMITGLNKYKKFKFDGYKIAFSKSAMCLNLFMDPRDREEEGKFLKDFLNIDDIVIDAGANIGTITIPASLICSKGRVISIEAHPITYGFLKENIALNNIKNVVTINKALGNKDGYVNFSDVSSDDQNKITTNSEGMEVPATTLDNLLVEYNINEIALLKIDVEGFEKFVLEGAGKSLDKTNTVYFEVWQKSFEYYNYSFTDIFTILKEKGFGIFKFNDGVSLTEVDESFRADVCQNLLAIRSVEGFSARTGYNVQPQQGK
ncbi:FkbM family methyltransferase [Ferruginibacter sp.]